MALPLADEYMPVYEISDAVATVVDAPPDAAWQALMAVDLIELGRRRPLVGLLGGVRMLPQLLMDLLRGKGLPKAPDRLTLRDTAADPEAEGSWIFLGERDHELALGLVGRFWRPVIRYASPEPSAFRDFCEPGYAKTVYALSATPLDDHTTLLRGEMRVATTDAAAGRWFRRYWTLGVGSGAHLLVGAVLDAAREAAEGVRAV
jgi:hypothetical protein